MTESVSNTNANNDSDMDLGHFLSESLNQIDVLSVDSVRHALTALSTKKEHLSDVITSLQQKTLASSHKLESERRSLIHNITELRKTLVGQNDGSLKEKIQTVQESHAFKELKDRIGRLERFLKAERGVRYLHSLFQEKRKCLHYVKEGHFEKAVASYHAVCESTARFFTNHGIPIVSSQPGVSADRELRDPVLDFVESQYGSFSGHFETIARQMYTSISDALTVRADTVLEALKWPKALSTDGGLEMEALRDICRISLSFFDPHDELFLRQTEIISDNLLPELHTPPLIKILVTPISRAFRFHFYGSRATNRLEKPEFFLSYVMNIIDEQVGTGDGFLETWMKDVVDEVLESEVGLLTNVKAVLEGLDLSNEFISDLLTLIQEKVSSIRENLLVNPQLFLHTVKELCLFDQKLVQTYYYEPRIASTRPSSPSSPTFRMNSMSTITWKGSLGFLLSSKDVVHQWLAWETDSMEEWYKEILDTSPAFDIYLGDTDVYNSALSKHTVLAEKVSTLLESAQKRLEMIFYPPWQIQFFVRVQIGVLERVLDTLKEVLEVIGGVLWNSGDEETSDKNISTVSSTLPGGATASKLVRALFPLSSMSRSTSPQRNTSSSQPQVSSEDPLVNLGKLCRCASSLLYLVKWMEDASQEYLYIQISEYILSRNGIGGSVFDEIISSYRSLLNVYLKVIVTNVANEFQLAVSHDA